MTWSEREKKGTKKGKKITLKRRLLANAALNIKKKREKRGKKNESHLKEESSLTLR